MIGIIGIDGRISLELLLTRPRGHFSYCLICMLLKNICDGTCIGDKDYYYNRGIVDGRAYAFGIATMFYDQYHQTFCGGIGKHGST